MYEVVGKSLRNHVSIFLPSEVLQHPVIGFTISIEQSKQQITGLSLSLICGIQSLFA